MHILTKKNFILLCSFIFLLILASCINPPVSTSASQEVTSEINRDVPIVRSTSNGITLEVKDAGVYEDYYRVNLCYTLPDGRDWNISIKPSDAMLEVDGQVFRVLEEKKTLRNNYATVRCSALDFRVNVADGEQVKLTIQKIFIPLSETDNCTDWQLKLDLAFSGIKIQCATEPHTSGFTVVRWPESMTFGEAQEYASNIITDAKMGPWIFQFTNRQADGNTVFTEATPTLSGTEVINNGIVMRLGNAHTEGLGYRVELCYTLPDKKDWLLTGPFSQDSQSRPTLLVMGDQIHPSEEGTMYWRYDTLGNIVERCEYLLFPVTQYPKSGQLSLFIPMLYGRISGQPDIGPEIRDKLAERNLNLSMDYGEIQGIPGFVWLRFPIGLIQADPVFASLFQQVRFDYHQGPWYFSFPVNPQ